MDRFSWCYDRGAGMLDIFSRKALNAAEREHILPAVLGGRLTSTQLINKQTNKRISVLERVLVSQFRFFLNALGMTSRRGKAVGYTLEPKKGAAFALTSGLKSEVRDIGMKVVVDENGQRRLNIKARTVEEAKRLLAGAKRRYPNLDLASGITKRKRVFNDAIFEHDWELGGAALFRVLAKTAFEGFALNAGNAAACERQFAPLRGWINKGLFEPADQDAGDFVQHDYRADLWSALPVLPDARFQHRVFVVGGPKLGGAYALVELFGFFRFSVLLAASEVTSCHFGYLVDPVTGSEARQPSFVLEQAVTAFQQDRGGADQMMACEAALHGATAAIDALLQERHFRGIWRPLFEKHLGRIPWPPSEAQINAFALEFGEEYARHHFRIDSEEVIELDADAAPDSEG